MMPCSPRTGTGQPLGLLNAAGINKRALTAPVSLDDLSDELMAIEAQGGTPTAIVTDPATFGILRKQKASGAGTYHLSPYLQSDSPGSVWGVPLISAPRLPLGTVIAMDARLVFCGIRRDASFAYADLFDNDVLGCRITTRWAGVEVMDPKAVRVLTGATGP
ncbi:phage major capsid protein [Yinghuangia aomiensis]